MISYSEKPGYDKDRARQLASRRSDKKHTPKWEPRLRYMENEQGREYSFSMNHRNRQERRRQDAIQRRANRARWRKALRIYTAKEREWRKSRKL